MSEQQASTIAPPPSIDDILSATADQSLIGRVDFTTLLAAPSVAEPEPAAAAPEPEPVEPEPVIVPEPEPVPVPVAVEPPAPATTPKTPARPRAKAKPRPRTTAKATPAPEPEPTVVLEPEPVIVEPVVAEAVVVEPIVEPEPAVFLAPVADELDLLGLAVEEVAQSVIATMRAAAEAHLRHLESIESEAARRCELLTAQAELDAELIRLHARREAHTIITAARMRDSAATAASADSRRLDAVGQTFSRFAEAIETAAAQAPGSPDRSPIS